MFERYTESARRALFFARYEASQFGSLTIETEHLLLGLIREDKGILGQILARATVPADRIRRETEGRLTRCEKVATSIEIPVSAEMNRVLQFATEEADRVGQRDVSTEHVLLGLLREQGSVAESVLTGLGLRLDRVREDIATLRGQSTEPGPAPELQVALHARILRETPELVRQVTALQALVEQLAQSTPATSEAHRLIERIRAALNVLRSSLEG